MLSTLFIPSLQMSAGKKRSMGILPVTTHGQHGRATVVCPKKN